MSPGGNQQWKRLYFYALMFQQNECSFQEFCESMRAIKRQVGNSEADAALAGWYPKHPQVYEALPAPDMELPDMSLTTPAQNAIGNYYERDPDLLPDAVRKCDEVANIDVLV